MSYYFKNSDSRAGSILGKITDAVFPMSTYCLCCGNIIDDTRKYALCNHCMDHIRWGNLVVENQETHPGYSNPDIVISCAGYGNYTSKLISDLKYNKKTYIARIIAEVMEDRIKNDPDTAEYILASDCIIPVPVSRERENERGFNQMARIGKHLSSSTGIPMADGAVIRNHNTEAQKKLSPSERFENLDGAFEISERGKELLKGKTVLIIDDIYTTGATAVMMTTVLKRAGVSTVYFMSFCTGNENAAGFFQSRFEH